VYYSIKQALSLAKPEDICVSTDDPRVIEIAQKLDIPVPFVRPHDLATDVSSMRDVLLHAVTYYEKHGRVCSTLVLLQPTSPFRTVETIKKALSLYDDGVDMVVTVREADPNPYYAVYEDDSRGLLKKTIPRHFQNRQECPPCYEFNGAVYVIRTDSIKARPVTELQRIRKVEMEALCSLDLDSELDWQFGEFLLEKGLLTLQ
jgi:N-acylneuraminate cytidylyltransferase